MSAFLTCCGSRRPAMATPAPRVVDPELKASLCAVCSDMFTKIIRGEQFDHLAMRHQRTIHGFVEAAGSGCWICWRLFQAIDDATQSTLLHIASSHKDYLQNAWGFSTAIAWVVKSDPGEFRLDLSFEFDEPGGARCPEAYDCQQCRETNADGLFQSLKNIAYFVLDRRREVRFVLIPTSAQGMLNQKKKRFITALYDLPSRSREPMY